MATEPRAYDLLRAIIKRHHGTMEYRREGFPHGAWIITLNGIEADPIRATGERSFPELDALYVPNVETPKHWDDYRHELIPGAEEKLLALHAKLSKGS